MPRSLLEKIVLALLLSGASAGALAAQAATPAETAGPEAARVAELEAMGRADQLHRRDPDSLRGDGPEARQRWKSQIEIDRRNVERLEAIVAESGWPGLSRVGPAAATAAFLIVQHAELEDQQRYLPLLREARDAGEARADLVALLEDRVRMREGRPQIYGTQVVIDRETGRREVYRIEDESRVEQLRAEVGLGPLAEYLAALGVIYEAPARPRPDEKPRE